METKGELIFQTALLLWVVLRSMNVIPNLELYITETKFQVLIGLILLAIAFFNPLIGILSTILLLINLKSSALETLFICIDEEDIIEILSTIDEETYKNTNNTTEEETVLKIKTKPVANTPPPPKKTKPVANTPPLPKKTKPVANTPPPPKKTNECDQTVLITPDMLQRAQTNVYDTKNNSLFFNETGEKGVNIQGIYESISGYDPIY
jgi:ABC-type multidrug transport system fused ATPase/permease subunit